MKGLKSLMAIVLMIGLCITANCQSRKDSSIIAIKDLRKAAILIEQGKACANELKLQERQIDLLIERVSLKDSIAGAYKVQVAYYDSIYKACKQGDIAYREKIKLMEKMYEGEIKKQRFKTYGLGVVIAGLVYLLFK